MKRIIALMFSLLLLSSCGLNINMFREPVALANKTYNRLIHAIKRQDDNAIKKLFSKTVKGELVNFEEQTKDFISFIQGDFVSSSLDYYCVGLDGLSESGKAKRAINFTFQCETSEQKYCFAVKEYVIDEFDSNNVGISSLFVIKENEWKEEARYLGDGEWTPGIHIANPVRIVSEEEKYYSQKDVYFSATGVVTSCTYRSDQPSAYLEFSDLTPKFDDVCFKIVGDNLSIVKANGIDQKIQVGDQIEFITAPKYFGDEYVMPIVAVSINGESLLNFEEGFANLMKWYEENSEYEY